MLDLIVRYKREPVARLVVAVPGSPDFDCGRFAPLVEYRVEHIEKLEHYALIEPAAKAAGDATLLLAGRRGPVSDERRAEALHALSVVAETFKSMDFVDMNGLPVDGIVTLLAEPTFRPLSLPAIGIALAGSNG